jgi:hypothetical protein
MPIDGSDSRVLATFVPAGKGDFAEAMALTEALLDEDLDWSNQNILRMCNNYLICCIKQGAYDRGAAVADRLQQVALANPHLYHNAACLYCFTGQPERAMEQIRLARQHGGMALMKLLADDEDLAPIAHREEFLELVGKTKPKPPPPGGGPAPLPY